MSSCIVCLPPLILKTHRWQSTLSGVNRKFRSSWYGYASTLNVLSISVVYTPWFIWCPAPNPQTSEGTYSACRLFEWTFRIHCLSFLCVLLYPISLIITFTNGNPVTDAPTCHYEAQFSLPAAGLKVCGLVHSLSKALSCFGFWAYFTKLVSIQISKLSHGYVVAHRNVYFLSFSWAPLTGWPGWFKLNYVCTLLFLS